MKLQSRSMISQTVSEKQIKVLFFGATADATQMREMKLAIAPNTRAKDVLEKIVNDFPALKNHKLLIAVNQEYAKDDLVLHDGDEVAIFTAVSGG